MSGIELENAIVSNDLDWLNSSACNFNWIHILFESIKLNSRGTFDLAIAKNIQNIITPTRAYIKAFKMAVKRNCEYYADKLYSRLPELYQWDIKVIKLGNLNIYKYLLDKFGKRTSLSNILNIAIKFRRTEFFDVIESAYSNQKGFNSQGFIAAVANKNMEYIDFFHQRIASTPKKYIEYEAIELVAFRQDIVFLELLISKGIGSWDDVKFALKNHKQPLPLVEEHLSKQELVKKKAQLCDKIANLTLQQLELLDSLVVNLENKK